MALRDPGVLENPGQLKFGLDGCVKVSTRTYWQRMLNDKQNDHTATIQEREWLIKYEKADDEPIPCKCSTPCPVGGPALFKCSDHEISTNRRTAGGA